MRSLARFADSPTGRFYAANCERYGVDPAQGMPSFLAANLRAVMHVTAARDLKDKAEREANPELAKARDLAEWVKTHGG